MGWLELLAWLKAMGRQRQGVQSSPDSWAGHEQDPWWEEQRRARDEKRRAARGF